MPHLFTSARPLPALSESARLRYATFIAMYFAQGIPVGLLGYAIPAWLAMHAQTPAQIAGYGVLIGLPWSLKLLVAPLIERFAWLPMGRRRPWLLAGQVGLTLSFAGLALLPDPLHHLALLVAGAIAVNFFTVFQDVATDSLAIDLVPPAQQGQANSLMWGAKLVGLTVALAGGSWLLNHAGFGATMLTAAALVGGFSLLPLLLRERPGEKRLPWTVGAASPAAARLQSETWGEIWQRMRRVFRLRDTRLLVPVVFFNFLCQTYFDASMAIFTVQQLGWTDTHFSQVYSAANLVGGVGGMLLGGWLMTRLGVVRVAQASMWGLAGLAALLGANSALWSHSGFIVGIITAFNVINALFYISLFALAMQCCWSRVSAVQFTLYMAVASWGNSAGTALMGLVRSQWSWSATYLVLAVLVLPGLWLLYRVQLAVQARQLAALESAHQAEEEQLALRVAV